jgi:hypothetical protein
MTKICGEFLAKVIKVDVRLFFVLAARIAFWLFVHAFWVYLLIKIQNFASYILNLLLCSLPVVAIIATCQIFLPYNK